MSGICGFVQKESLIQSFEYFYKKMQSWNLPYGKKRSETYNGDSFLLTCYHDALTTSPLSDKLVLHIASKYAVLDAIIYNRDELIKKYSLSATSSDEELIFTCITQYGMDTLCDINGDFAGAIYDQNEKSLTLFRDHLGVRPLYYYSSDTAVTFSTDIRGLISLPMVDVSLNENWFYHAVCGFAYINTTHTEFEHIYSVPPASYISFSLEDMTVSTKRYWTPGENKLSLPSNKAYFEKLRELITDSIQKRLNVFPGVIGAELSGGLDSGVIDILINRLNREGLYFSWSVDPSDVPLVENDERAVISDICSQENIICHFPDTNGYNLKDTNSAKTINKIQGNNPESSFIFDQFAFPPHINTLSILTTSEYISKQGANIVFCGHGGDEGVSHRCNPYELFYHHEYYHYFKHFYSTTQGKNFRLLRTLQKCYINLFVTAKNLKTPTPTPFSCPELIKKNMHERYKSGLAAISFAYDPKAYIIKGALRNRADVTALLGAFAGVRYIMPFLDYRLIDFAVSIPRHLYLNGKQNRYIYREAFKDIIPQSLYNLTIKANNSKNAEPLAENWYEKFVTHRDYTINSLNKEFWEKYIDYDLINSWSKRGKPSTVDENDLNTTMMYALTICKKFQNVIEQVRRTP